MAVKKITRKTQNNPHIMYGVSIMEIITSVIAFLFAMVYYNTPKNDYITISLIFVLIDIGLFIFDLIYHRIIKYYTIDENGKCYTYKKLKYSDDKTIDKNKKYIQYVINKKNIESVDNKRIFVIVYGNITERQMEGREIKSSKEIKKLIIPYYINGEIK